MNVDELKQSLTAIADEARPDVTDPAQRVDGVDHKVRGHRRNTIVGTVAAAVVAIGAVAGVPALLDDSAPTQPADNKDSSGLKAVTDHGVSFYTSPAGARLIGHGVGEPGATEISFTFTPSTLDLSWTDDCWDSQVNGLDKGAWFTSSVNGHPLGSSTCQGSPPSDPLDGAGAFGSSPAANEKGWRDFGVIVGKPSTFTLKIDKHAERAIASQLVAGVWERNAQVETDGVWYDEKLVYKGHTYQVVGADVADLDGTRVVTASVDLPASDHPLYVYRGAEHVTHGLLLRGGSSGLMQLGKGVPGGGSGDTVSPDRTTAIVRAHPRNPETRGQIYVVAYEQID